MMRRARWTWSVSTWRYGIIALPMLMAPLGGCTVDDTAGEENGATAGPEVGFSVGAGGTDTPAGAGGAGGSQQMPPVDPPAVEGELGEIANGMMPGSWVELVTNGFDNGAITVTPENGSVLEFSDEATWDPIHHKLYILGVARGNGGYGIPNQKWIEYSEATNTWTDITSELPNGFYIGHHAYDHMAFDPARGHYYVRFDNIQNPTIVQRYDTIGDVWELMPAMPPNANNFGAIEYFPDRDRLVFTDTSNKQFALFDPQTSQWSTEPWNGAVYTDHNITEYDPAGGRLYFGGGMHAPLDFYKMESSGEVTKLATPPVPLGIGATVHTVDPVTGHFLVFENDGIIYEYDPDADLWAQAGAHPLAGAGRLMAVTAKIPEYGVLISVSYNPGGGTTGVYLYKH